MKEYKYIRGGQRRDVSDYDPSSVCCQPCDDTYKFVGEDVWTNMLSISDISKSTRYVCFIHS